MMFKPLLAATVTPDQWQDLRYPLLASPKLDGVRAIVRDGKVLSRSLKPIPNNTVQMMFGRLQAKLGKSAEGLDGELIWGDPTDPQVFNLTMSAVMGSEPVGDQVSFHVFDLCNFRQDAPFSERYDILRHAIKRKDTPAAVKLVAHKTIRSPRELEAYEATQLALGYEGVMLRSLDGLYKHGRSTLKEGYLLKVKRFETSEAIVLGATALMHNENTPTTDNLGHQVRSSKKAGKVEVDLLGSLRVRDVHSGVEFEIGSGFTAGQRLDYWNAYTQGSLDNQVVTYKFQPAGTGEKPRFPVFIGFRDERDLSI